jgi:hypothetical protein
MIDQWCKAQNAVTRTLLPLVNPAPLDAQSHVIMQLEWAENEINESHYCKAQQHTSYNIDTTTLSTQKHHPRCVLSVWRGGVTIGCSTSQKMLLFTCSFTSQLSGHYSLWMPECSGMGDYTRETSNLPGHPVSGPPHSHVSHQEYCWQKCTIPKVFPAVETSVH